MGGSACLAGTVAAGQANPRGSKSFFVCFRPSAKISGRWVTKFQQKLLALIGYRGCPGVYRGSVAGHEEVQEAHTGGFASLLAPLGPQDQV